MDEYVTFVKKSSAESAQQANKSVSVGITFVAGGGLLAMVLGILIAVFLTRGITKPLNRVIAGLGEASDQVASASSQVSSTSQSLAEGTSEQGRIPGRDLLLPGRDLLHDPPERGERIPGKGPYG